MFNQLQFWNGEYLYETMIFEPFGGCDAHSFLRARQPCAFSTIGVPKSQSFLLGPGNSVWMAINQNHVYPKAQINCTVGIINFYKVLEFVKHLMI
jgi:hypothetical protein